MNIQNFSIFKNSYKKEENHPDYVISAKDEKGAYTKIGACWKRTTPKGENYLSCSITGVNTYPVQNMKPGSNLGSTGLTSTEAQTIKTLRENEIKRQEANKELDVEANAEFENW